jgi:hypothetical protein
VVFVFAWGITATTLAQKQIRYSPIRQTAHKPVQTIRQNIATEGKPNYHHCQEQSGKQEPEVQRKDSLTRIAA